MLYVIDKYYVKYYIIDIFKDTLRCMGILNMQKEGALDQVFIANKNKNISLYKI